MTSTPDLVARLRDGIVVQQAGPSSLIGTPDFAATVALMREAAERLKSLSTVERDRDAAREVYLTLQNSSAVVVGRLANSQAEVARLTEALKQHERILLIITVRNAAEASAPLWLKAADDAIAALQGGRG